MAAYLLVSVNGTVIRKEQVALSNAQANAAIFVRNGLNVNSADLDTNVIPGSTIDRVYYPVTSIDWVEVHEDAT